MSRRDVSVLQYGMLWALWAFALDITGRRWRSRRRSGDLGVADQGAPRVCCKWQIPAWFNMIQVKKLRQLRGVLHSTSKETCGGKEANLSMFLSSALLLGVSFVLLDWLAHAKVWTNININAGQILAMISTLSPFRVVVDFQSVRTCGCHWESNARLIWMLPAKAPSSPSLMRMSWKLSCTQSLNGSAWLTFRWSVKKEIIVSSAFETISMVRILVQRSSLQRSRIHSGLRGWRLLGNWRQCWCWLALQIFKDTSPGILDDKYRLNMTI